jgi:hypothetical protein
LFKATTSTVNSLLQGDSHELHWHLPVLQIFLNKIVSKSSLKWRKSEKLSSNILSVSSIMETRTVTVRGKCWD